MRMVTGIAMTRSAAGHRREKGDLARAGNRRIGFDMGVVDRGADHPWRFEGVGVGFGAPRPPGHQIVNGANARRRLDRLFGHADTLAHPGEILDLHASSSSM